MSFDYREFRDQTSSLNSDLMRARINMIEERMVLQALRAHYRHLRAQLSKINSKSGDTKAELRALFRDLNKTRASLKRSSERCLVYIRKAERARRIAYAHFNSGQTEQLMEKLAAQ